MLIYVKNIKINLKKKKKLFTDRQTDRRTDGQPKTIVRNLTKTIVRNLSITQLYIGSTHINDKKNN